MARALSDLGPITLGCMSLGTAPPGAWNEQRLVPDRATGIAWVRQAYDLGIRHFDTAQRYGEGLSEEWLGEALSVLPRDDLLITTKVSAALPGQPHAFCAANIRAVCDQARRRLRTGHLDYLMFHHLQFGPYADEAVDTMEALVRAGAIRAYAACPTFPIRRTVSALPRLHPGHWHTHGGPLWHAPGDPDLAWAASRGEPVVIFAPYLYGMLTGAWGEADLDRAAAHFRSGGGWVHPWCSPPASPHGFYDRPHGLRAILAAIDAAKREFGVDAAGFRSLLLRYDLSLRGVASVCLGFSKLVHITEAAAIAAQKPLTADEARRFHAVMQGAWVEG